MSAPACLYVGFNHHAGKTRGNESVEQEEASQGSGTGLLFMMDVFFVRPIINQEYFMLCKVGAIYAIT